MSAVKPIKEQLCILPYAVLYEISTFVPLHFKIVCCKLCVQGRRALSRMTILCQRHLYDMHFNELTEKIVRMLFSRDQFIARIAHLQSVCAHEGSLSWEVLEIDEVREIDEDVYYGKCVSCGFAERNRFAVL